jgi:hypothetical protein
MMTPTFLMVALQLWAIIGSYHHPITMLPDLPAASTFDQALVDLASRDLHVRPGAWPFPQNGYDTTSTHLYMDYWGLAHLVSDAGEGWVGDDWEVAGRGRG